MSSTPYRNLAIESSPDFRRGFPVKPTDWSDSELAEWKAVLLAKRWTERFSLEEQWERMLEARAQALELTVPYAHNRLPPAEVVAELPRELLAQRACFYAPEVALLSDAVFEQLQAIGMATERATAASAMRLSRLLGVWAPGRGHNGYARVSRNTQGGPAALPGGLRAEVVGGVIEVRVGGQLFCRGAASDAQAPRLRRLASLWGRMVRGAVAVSLRVGVEMGPSLRSTLALVLPAGGAGHDAEVYVAGRCVEKVRRTVLWDTNLYADRQERQAMAGLMLRRGAGNPDFEACVQRQLEAIFGGCPVRALQSGPNPLAVSERIDLVSHRMVTAYAGDVVVPLRAAADRYEVRVDDITGPALLATVHSLALAVDLERANRREVGMRLRLGVAA